MEESLLIEETKKCSTCNKYKSFDNYHKTKRNTIGAKASCKECQFERQQIRYYNRSQEKIEKDKEKQKFYYNRNKEKIKNQKIDYKHTAKNNELYKRYGITMIQYEELVKIQNNLCAICGKPETELTIDKSRVRKLSVDHCHKSNKVRGLLCSKCNKGIGCFNDISETLLNAAKYLENHKNLLSL